MFLENFASISFSPFQTGKGTAVAAHHTVVFDDGEYVEFHNKSPDQEAHFVLLAGEPIGEPVVQHGPFVMNTREEIHQTIADYQTSKNGFEKARTWQSKFGNF